MANCVNPQCRQPIQDEFYYCPLCGTDNRPPEKRQAVDTHTHQFGGFKGRYCIWCGEPIDEPYRFGHKWRLIFAWSLTIVGSLLVLTVVGSLLATYSTGGFWDRHFGAMAKAQYWDRGRYGHWGTYRRYGPEVAYMAGLGGILTLWTAIQMFLKLPLSRRRRGLFDDDSGW